MNPTASQRLCLCNPRFFEKNRVKLYLRAVYTARQFIKKVFARLFQKAAGRGAAPHTDMRAVFTARFLQDRKAKSAPCLSAGSAGSFSSDQSRNYSLILETTPEPTVRPPSRIAKRRPSSIAIGVISSTSMETLSPGMHISTPSGREMVPVTSVVRK